MKKFLFLCSAVDVGGLETYLLRFLQYMRGRDAYEFHVLCKSGRLGTLAQSFTDADARLIPMKQGYLGLADWWRLKQLIQREGYRAICDFTANFAGVSLMMARWAGCPWRLAFFRQSQEFFKPTLLRRAYCRTVNRLTYWNANAVLSNSRAAFEAFFAPHEWQHKSRFEVIPNGIPWRTHPLEDEHRERLRADLNLPPKGKVVGHVGRYLPQKNYAAILDVAEQLREPHPDAVVLLIGRGVRENLEASVSERGLTNVRFAGERRDVLDLLSLMDAFYFPSLTEGQPNAVLEAAAAGIPFVVSDIPPMRECFPRWWGNRWMVEPQNTVAATELLDQHLLGTARHDPEFGKLTTWIRQHNSPEECFERFLARLENTECLGHEDTSRAPVRDMRRLVRPSSSRASCYGDH